MTSVCLTAENSSEHSECHASACQCICHDGNGGVCDCAEKEAIEEARRFEEVKAYWRPIVGAEFVKDIEDIRRSIIRDFMEHRISESEQLKSIEYLNKALAIFKNEKK